jgi:flagellar basal-body rod modification protein FlgD
MSSIDTSGTSASGVATDASGNPLVNPSTQMDESSFLQLLVAQLQYQDPLSPTDSQAFVQEQAQFSEVEGLLNVENSVKQLISTTQLGQDINLIGKQITYSNSDGSTSSGVVGGVSTDSDGNISLSVGGDTVDPSTVVGIAAGPDPTVNVSITGSTTPSSSSSTSTGDTSSGG